MKKILLLFIVLVPFLGLSQSDSSENQYIDTVGDEVFEFVEQMPTYPKGEAGVLLFLAENVTLPPLKDGVMGSKIVIEFIVEKDGSLSNLRVIKSFSDEAAQAYINAFKKMPKWAAGTHNRRAVRTKMRMPIIVEIR